MTAAILYEALDDVTTDHIVTVQAAKQLCEELAAGLAARGYEVRKKPKPRKAATPVEPYVVDTGNPQIDAFMRAHHDPKWKPLRLPTSPGHPSISLTEKDRAQAEWDWANACKTKADEAQEALAEAIRIHRSPWTFRGDVYRSTEHEWRIERHRGRTWSDVGWKLYDPHGVEKRPPSGGAYFLRFDDAERAIPTR